MYNFFRVDASHPAVNAPLRHSLLLNSLKWSQTLIRQPKCEYMNNRILLVFSSLLFSGAADACCFDVKRRTTCTKMN